MSLIEHIRDATSFIAQKYMDLPVSGRGVVKRERVYCYELYHQLRLSLGDRRFTVSAEPDKRGNPGFDKRRGPNPDLIVHLPGSNRHNIAIIEVECRPDLTHLRKDLRTFKLMRSKGYRTFVLLLFGVEHIPWQKLSKAADEIEFPLTDLVVLLHRRAQQSASIESPDQARAA